MGATPQPPPREAVPNAAVPILLQLLDLPNNANREEALDLLCELVGGAWGAEGEALGVAIRDAGGISTITNLLETDEEMIQQALFLIANLASDAVDAQSALTKRQLLAIGAAPKLLTCLSSPETEVIAYAAAALQNCSTDPAWAAALADANAIPIFEALLGHSSPIIQRYAAGAVKNVVGVLRGLLGAAAKPGAQPSGSGLQPHAVPLVNEATMHKVQERAREAAIEKLTRFYAVRRLQRAWRSSRMARRRLMREKAAKAEEERRALALKLEEERRALALKLEEERRALALKAEEERAAAVKVEAERRAAAERAEAQRLEAIKEAEEAAARAEVERREQAKAEAMRAAAEKARRAAEEAAAKAAAEAEAARLAAEAARDAAILIQARRRGALGRMAAAGTRHVWATQRADAAMALQSAARGLTARREVEQLRLQIASQIAEMARLEAEREAAQLEAARALAEAAAAAEAERLAAEAARLAAEKAEAERLAAEAERRAAEAAAAARARRLAEEKAEAERLAAEKAEAERIAAERDGAAVKLQSSRRGRMGRRTALSYRIAAALLPLRPHPHVQLAWCVEAVLSRGQREEAVLSRGQRHACEAKAATTIAAAHRGKAARKKAPGVVMKHPPKPPPLPAPTTAPVQPPAHHVRPSKIDLDEGPDAPPIQQQIAAALRRNAGKVLDLFRAWDANGDGEVSKKEFRKAMPTIGLDVPVQEVDALFDSWDQDGGGVLHYKELSKVLRSPAPPPTSVKQALVSDSREAAAATTIAAAHRGKAARKKAPGVVMKHPPKPRKAQTQTRDTTGVFARESQAEAACKQAVGVAESASKTAAAKHAESEAAAARAEAARAEAARTAFIAARAASVANAAAMAEAAAKKKAAVREAAAKEAAAKAAKEAAAKEAAAAEALAKQAAAEEAAAAEAAKEVAVNETAPSSALSQTLSPERPRGLALFKGKGMGMLTPKPAGAVLGSRLADVVTLALEKERAEAEVRAQRASARAKAKAASAVEMAIAAEAMDVAVRALVAHEARMQQAQTEARAFPAEAQASSGELETTSKQLKKQLRAAKMRVALAREHRDKAEAMTVDEPPTSDAPRTAPFDEPPTSDAPRTAPIDEPPTSDAPRTAPEVTAPSAEASTTATDALAVTTGAVLGASTTATDALAVTTGAVLGAPTTATDALADQSLADKVTSASISTAVTTIAVQATAEEAQGSTVVGLASWVMSPERAVVTSARASGRESRVATSTLLETEEAIRASAEAASAQAEAEAAAAAALRADAEAAQAAQAAAQAATAAAAAMAHVATVRGMRRRVYLAPSVLLHLHVCPTFEHRKPGAQPAAAAAAAAAALATVNVAAAPASLAKAQAPAVTRAAAAPAAASEPIRIQWPPATLAAEDEEEEEEARAWERAAREAAGSSDELSFEDFERLMDMPTELRSQINLQGTSDAWDEKGFKKALGTMLEVNPDDVRVLSGTAGTPTTLQGQGAVLAVEYAVLFQHGTSDERQALVALQQTLQRDLASALERADAEAAAVAERSLLEIRRRGEQHIAAAKACAEAGMKLMSGSAGDIQAGLTAGGFPATVISVQAPSLENAFASFEKAPPRAPLAEAAAALEAAEAAAREEEAAALAALSAAETARAQAVAAEAAATEESARAAAALATQAAEQAAAAAAERQRLAAAERKRLELAAATARHAVRRGVGALGLLRTMSGLGAAAEVARQALASSCIRDALATAFQMEAERLRLAGAAAVGRAAVKSGVGALRAAGAMGSLAAETRARETRAREAREEAERQALAEEAVRRAFELGLQMAAAEAAEAAATLIQACARMCIAVGKRRALAAATALRKRRAAEVGRASMQRGAQAMASVGFVRDRATSTQATRQALVEATVQRVMAEALRLEALRQTEERRRWRAAAAATGRRVVRRAAQAVRAIIRMRALAGVYCMLMTSECTPSLALNRPRDHLHACVHSQRRRRISRGRLIDRRRSSSSSEAHACGLPCGCARSSWTIRSASSNGTPA
jgi:trimeric autotransporter adhesin